MTWVFIIGLAIACFAVMVFVLKAPRGTREAIAAALLLGISGYVTQGSPGQRGAPKDATDTVASEQAALLVQARQKITDSGIPPTDRWIVTADGFSRNGQSAEAAQLLRKAVEDDPENAEAWLAMANALVAHADGTLTPAALYAFRRAASADSEAPGPPFFLGLALAQSGKYAEAREMWFDLFQRAKPDAKWRPLLALELMRLDAVINAGNPAAAAGALPAGVERESPAPSSNGN